MRKLIQERINDLLDELGTYHLNTFRDNFEDDMEEEEFNNGVDVDNYIQGMEMTETEDACYLAGKIDAYKEVCGMIWKSKPIDPLTLANHNGHNLTIVKYGNRKGGIEDITIECKDCNVRLYSNEDALIPVSDKLSGKED